MKLLIFGSTGFVATELIRRSLSNPSITSLVAIGRRPLSAAATAAAAATAPNDADLSKLESVVMDFDSPTAYDSEPIRSHLATANACIWTIAVTPAQVRSVPWETVERVCHGYTVDFLKKLLEVNPGKVKFVYVSGFNAARDQTKKPMVLGDYCLLRGRVENHVLEMKEANKEKLDEVCIAKPGIIEGEGKTPNMLQSMFYGVIGLPSVRVEEIGAALVNGVVKGFGGMETMMNDDLVRVGRGVLIENGEKVEVKSKGLLGRMAEGAPLVLASLFSGGSS